MCTVLFSFFFLHLVGAYIYSDGKYVGVAGGSIRVGFVADYHPDPLNPLAYGTGKIDDMMYNLLFRSLIRYNSNHEIYEGDLANCDISQLKSISCSLRDDAIWSDNTPITSEDVVATMNAFAQNANSKSIKNVLKNTKITAVDEKNITFESSTANTALIEALSYPIIRSDVLDQIKNNRLKKESYITSGPFVFDDSSENTDYGFFRISLKTNPNYKKTVWLEKFHFNIFPDMASMERGIDVTTIIIPPTSRENTLKTSGLYKGVKFAQYEYFGIFFQTDRLDQNIRNILHRHIAARFKDNTPEVSGQIPSLSLFQSGSHVLGKEPAMNFITFMTEKGYKKKYVLLAEAKSTETSVTSGGTIPKLQYFSNGGGRAILFSNDPKAEITLTGKAPAATRSVTINDYTLQEYEAGNTSFVYKISAERGTLKTGKNTYTLSLAQRDGSTLTETLTIYHTLDAEHMTQFESEVQSELIAELNTPEKIAEREQQKSERIAAIEALSDDAYYNEKLEPFVLKVAFMSDKEVTSTYMNFVVESLKQLGILVEPLPLAAKELDALIKSGEKDYDMIIVGVQSPGTISHLGKAFFSSENGNPNFSNITSKNFEALFDSLQNVTEIEKVQEIEQKITDYMNEFSFFLPLSRPEHTLYIDKNIKGLYMPAVISGIPSLAYTFDTLSIKDYYEKNLENKSLSGFFSWLGSGFHAE